MSNFTITTFCVAVVLCWAIIIAHIRNNELACRILKGVILGFALGSAFAMAMIWMGY